MASDQPLPGAPGSRDPSALWKWVAGAILGTFLLAGAFIWVARWTREQRWQEAEEAGRLEVQAWEAMRREAGHPVVLAELEWERPKNDASGLELEFRATFEAGQFFDPFSPGWTVPPGVEKEVQLLREWSDSLGAPLEADSLVEQLAAGAWAGSFLTDEHALAMARVFVSDAAAHDPQVERILEFDGVDPLVLVPDFLTQDVPAVPWNLEFHQVVTVRAAKALIEEDGGALKLELARGMRLCDYNSSAPLWLRAAAYQIMVQRTCRLLVRAAPSLGEDSSYLAWVRAQRPREVGYEYYEQEALWARTLLDSPEVTGRDAVVRAPKGHGWAASEAQLLRIYSRFMDRLEEADAPLDPASLRPSKVNWELEPWLWGASLMAPGSSVLEGVAEAESWLIAAEAALLAASEGLVSARDWAAQQSSPFNGSVLTPGPVEAQGFTLSIAGSKLESILICPQSP